GHPIARMDADRGDLPALGPDARVADVPLCADTQLGQGVDQGLFDLPEIPVQVLAMTLEVNNWIANELSRAMKGDVAAAFDLEQVNSAPSERLGRGEKMPFLARPAERDDGRMLDQKEDVLSDGAVDSGASNGALELERLGVRHQSAIFDPQLTHL